MSSIAPLVIVVVILALYAVVALWALDEFFHSDWWERRMRHRL